MGKNKARRSKSTPRSMKLGEKPIGESDCDDNMHRRSKSGVCPDRNEIQSNMDVTEEDVGQSHNKQGENGKQQNQSEYTEDGHQQDPTKRLKRSRDTESDPECVDKKPRKVDKNEDIVEVAGTTAGGDTGQSDHEDLEIVECPPSNSHSQHEQTKCPRDRDDLDLDTSTSVQKDTGGGSRSHRPKIRTRVFEDDQYAYFIMNHPESVILKGKANLGCLCGSVEIFGYTISQGCKMYPVYSADTNSLLTVNTKNSSDASGSILNDSLSKISSDSLRREVEDAVSSVDSPVVLRIQRLDDNMMKYFSTIQPYQTLFSSNKCKYGSHDDDEVFADSVVQRPHSIGLYELDPRINSLTIGKDYSNVADWLAKRLVKDPSPVIVVCGGKDVGKSTMTRYLINKIIDMVSTVAFLECDLGQTEFTPPGCVSFSKVTSPVFGPPFSHQREPVCSCFVGALSPQNDPKYYMRCVTHVFHQYLSMKKKCPLIVNTMGWIEGIGLGFLADTLQLVRPDLVVQLESHNKYKNMQMVTTEFVSSKSGWISKDGNNFAEEDNLKSHALLLVKSGLTQDMESRFHQRRYRPADHRNLSLMMHLGQSIFPETKSKVDFSSVSPFEVPWCDVAVHVAHSAVPNSHIMYAINARVVALCKVADDSLIESDIEGYPKFVKGSPLFETMGFGIVRGIDQERKVFYVITSVPSNKRSQVNCLVQGAVELPSQLLMGQRSSSAVLYVGSPKDVMGSSSVGPRRHILKKPRRSGQGPPKD